MTPRRILGCLASLLPLVGMLAAGAVIAPAIGPVMASHWSSGNTPDGYSNTWLSFGIFAAVVAAITAIAIVFVVRPSQGTTARLYAGIATLTGAILAAGWVITALATVQASSPDRAVIGLNWLVLLAAPAVAAIVILLVPSRPRSDPDGHPVAALPLDADERVAWSGVTGSTSFLLMGVGVTAVGIIGLALVLASAASAGAIVGAVACVVAGLSTLLLARVRLTVDQRGMRLASTLFRVPLMRIPLASIASVEAETIDPLRWGGWGYRFSGSGRAYVTRRSAGLVVTNRAGFASAVTIEDAGTAASVIQTLIDRAPTPHV